MGSDDSHANANVLGADGDSPNSYDSHANANVLGADGDSPDSDGDIVDYDDNYNDSYYDSYYDEYGNFDWDAYWDAYWNKYMTNSSNMSSWSDLTCGNASAIVTSNVTKYDFHDAYRVRVVDDKGKPVFVGKVDFFVNHELVGSSFVDYDGIAYFNLDSHITASGTYDIVSMYSCEGMDDTDSILARQRIEVDDVPMNERDIQIINEGIKLYDLGEFYNVRIVDHNGNPVNKGYVCFVVYDRVFYSDLSDDGLASCFMPLDLNFTGNLLVWSIYSDGDLYNLASNEQITIGTRTFVSLDKTSIGSRMVNSWNGYDFVYYYDELTGVGKYIAQLDDGVSLVIELNGDTYLLYEATVHNGSELMSIFRSIGSDNSVNKYDVVRLNLLENVTYVLNGHVYSDQEWDYVSRFAYGQLVVNGNGAIIKGNYDLNFMYVGADANVNFLNVNITNFDHVFVNHGSVMCRDCVFCENEAFKSDIKVWGVWYCYS